MYNAKPVDWLGMIALVITFGSAFMFTKISVQEYPPEVVAGGRIIIAAIALIILSIFRKDSFSFLKNHWLLLIALAFFGCCLPFYLISWGQQTVDSNIAGILMAVMPLTTIVLAHFFVAGERLTANRVIGFMLGFVGILILFGPTALANFDADEGRLIAMLAILAGAVSYAINTIIAKRLPNESFVALSAAVMTIASLIMLPAILLTGQEWELSIQSVEFLSLILLGIFPTALATIIYFAVIARVGPSFLSQINYLIPVWAVIIGILFLNESISINAIIALGVILLGIAIAQRKGLSFARF
ncbi:MAG: EamA family transporter [Gammaproteobacteria bacterium]|nr:MAG: EamA family transporter [Gammaproteobacteria bacterium]